MRNEAHARIKINQLRTEAGWRFLDDEQSRANILLENHVKITQRQMDAWGNDYEKTKNGCLDFLLVDSGNKPICVLEAKKESLHRFVFAILKRIAYLVFVINPFKKFTLPCPKNSKENIALIQPG